MIDPALTLELQRIDKRLLAVEATPIKLAAHDVELTGLKEDIARVESSVGLLHGRISALREDLSARDEREAERRQLERDERKTDRRWWTGSVFTAAGLVIAAIGLLADKL